MTAGVDTAPAAARLPHDDTLADAARVVAHPLRPRILRLATTRTSPSVIAEALGERLGNVSYHVRQLAAAGLLRRAGTVPRRGAVEHFYRTDTAALRDLAAALEREIAAILEAAEAEA